MFFVLAIAFHLYWFGRGVLSTIPMNQFDGALRFIAENAVRQGWTLYRDISIVYPPGYALFFGLFSPELKQSVAALLLICLVCVCVYALKKMFQCSLYDWRISFFLLVSALWYQQIPGDTFAVPFVMSLIILMKWGINRIQANSSVLIVLISAALVFCRWDFPILLFFLSGGVAMYELLFLKKRVMFNVLLPLGVGTALGFGGLMLFAISQQTISQAFESIFIIPAQVILPFRSLPLPVPWHAPRMFNSLLYVSCAIWVILVFVQKRKHIIDLFLLLSPVIFLPYATGRADWPHALPLLSLIVLVYICSSLQNVILKTGLGIVLLLYLVKLLLPNTIEHVSAYKEVSQRIQACSTLVSQTQAKSIFVGRDQYDHYIFNTAALYLARPDLQPATPYISDEPGLQNSCLYGERIGQQLLGASKPMLSFIEQGEQPAEPNATRNMRSCGKIEEVVHTMPYDLIGTCEAYDQVFDVRLYN